MTLRKPRTKGKDQELAEVLHALSDSTRLGIVRSLSTGAESACGCFAHHIAPSTLSHHLRVLRLAGIIDMRREGRMVMNSLRKDHLDKRFPGLLRAIL